jgi:hypothetical protein
MPGKPIAGRDEESFRTDRKSGLVPRSRQNIDGDNRPGRISIAIRNAATASFNSPLRPSADAIETWL